MMEDAFIYIREKGCDRNNSSTCINYEHWKDGCYARAHKMAEHLWKRYRVRCKKVFAFGRLNLHGCIGAWEYHVALLVYVDNTMYVFDPSLSPSKALPLSEWKKILEPNIYYNIQGIRINPWHYYKIKDPLPRSSSGTILVDQIGYYSDNDFSHTNEVLRKIKRLGKCDKW